LEGRLELEGQELSRTIATVQGWAEQQFRAVRGEFTVARVNDSAAEIVTRRAQKRLASAAPPAESNPAPATTGSEPGNEDGEPTIFLERDLPIYAPRSLLIRPPAPLAHPDLIGSEDIVEEAALPHLGPEEKTPPRGCSAMLLPVFQAPKAESA